MNLMSKIYIFFVVFLVLFSTSYSKTNTITYTCKGLSNFEIIGTPGVKEEMKEVTYDFINGALQDLNNIECNWNDNIITCESTFLNFRKLSVDQKSLKVTDFISGNKGFGQYIENFIGDCKEK
ncbi:hypothetical protein OAT33_00990 [Methylophilaceae bacterium]|nr:hypothetical protein [Methylophilaceae bacterium]MDC1173127.1 hypothetical protein [Methylophilaceae bacterium]|tara:strand:+ start:892 stop:1260 length:369 start_codon:yes stop_codon:yes gene_type:complete